MFSKTLIITSATHCDVYSNEIKQIHADLVTPTFMWLPWLHSASASEVLTMQGGQVLLEGAPEDALEVPQEALRAAW